MHLVAHMCTGPTNHHLGSWRHPTSDVEQVLDPARYERIAQIYERGCFDGVFIVDYQGIRDLQQVGEVSRLARWGGQLAMLDPLLTLACMARATTRIGLAGTMSTTLNSAYSIARAFATLDHFTNGRAGWNVVTSTMDSEAKAYGQDKLMEKSLRYEQADQAINACMELWHAWTADALKVDKAGGVFADPSGINYVEFEGSLVKLKCGFSTPRSPQDHPVLMQAGASDLGRSLGAKWGEIIFTMQRERDGMRKFYADMKSRMAEFGRAPGECAILPAIDVVVGETASAAAEKAEEIDILAAPEVAIAELSNMFKMDLSIFPRDTSLSDIRLTDKGPSAAGIYDNLMQIRKDGRVLTLGEAAEIQATTTLTPRFVGTPRQIVDEMEAMFEDACCDGFIITNTPTPSGCEDFVDLVVPELQRRGVFRDRYTGRTFRDHLRES